jgi:hypothetical protein
LTITFNTERDDAMNEGQVIAGVRVSYEYLENHPEPDFNSVEDICAINNWRRQIFGRNFPPQNKARELWLQSEKNLVLDLMRQQFERHKYISWNKLANDYNRQMALSAIIQHSGEHYVKSSGRLDGLKENRVAPWRTKQAIMGQATSRWSEYHDLLEAFQPTLKDEANGSNNNHAGNSPDSGDEEELADPSPQPRSSVTRRRARKSKEDGKKTMASTKSSSRRRRKRTYKEIEEDGDEEEESELGSEEETTISYKWPAAKRAKQG